MEYKYTHIFQFESHMFDHIHALIFADTVTKEYELPINLQKRNESFEKDYPRIVKVLNNDRVLLFTNNG